MMTHTGQVLAAVGASTLLVAVGLWAGPRNAPPGLFKNLDDEILGDAIILEGKQLFIDDHVIDKLDGVQKVLNQPVKHAANPLLVRDKPWEESGPGYSTVIYDNDEGIYKLWYSFWRKTEGTSTSLLCYATSQDGLNWQKPIINEAGGTNIVFQPAIQGFQCAGIFKDFAETDPQKRYKMLFSANPDGTAKTWSVGAAYSPDGIRWTAEEQYPLIPFSDTQLCPFWDATRGRYVAYLRFGPPNTRLCSRIESEDFVHWSPKVTLFQRSKLDAPFDTKHYAMQVMPYEGVYIGLLDAYHGETIQRIPGDKLWMDKTNVQLTFSRNGVTWNRVGKHGTLTPTQLREQRDWTREAEQATFLPYGEHGKDWDWGAAFACYQPAIVAGKELRFYYFGHTGRHWARYHGDTVVQGFGLATLRLDGFVSIETENEGSLTTKPLLFLGDALEINADASGGSIRVEALDASGKRIDGFSATDGSPITTDSTGHVLRWRNSDDCHLLQGSPIRLRFHLRNAKLYSFTPRIRKNHYVQSYD